MRHLLYLDQVRHNAIIHYMIHPGERVGEIDIIVDLESVGSMNNQS